MNITKQVETENILEDSIKIDINVIISADYTLVKKYEDEGMQKKSTKAEWGKMKDLEEKLKKRRDWILEKILYNPKFKDKLNSEKGGFVYYPKSRGENWVFKANDMSDF